MRQFLKARLRSAENSSFIVGPFTLPPRAIFNIQDGINGIMFRYTYVNMGQSKAIAMAGVFGTILKKGYCMIQFLPLRALRRWHCHVTYQRLSRCFSGGASDFVSLSDTPSSLTGEAGKFLVVNSGGTALSLIAAPIGVKGDKGDPGTDGTDGDGRDGRAERIPRREGR